jgi:hypothetical protein
MCHSELVRNLRPKVSKNAQGVKESKELMKECVTLPKSFKINLI